MECAGDVTFRRVRATHVVGDMKKVLHILSVLYSLRYSASKWHAPYCHLCPVPLYHIFPHFLINGTIFGKTVTEHKMFIIYCRTSVCNIAIFFILRRNELDVIKIVWWCLCKVPAVLVLV